MINDIITVKGIPIPSPNIKVDESEKKIHKCAK